MIDCMSHETGNTSSQVALRVIKDLDAAKFNSKKRSRAASRSRVAVRGEPSRAHGTPLEHGTPLGQRFFGDLAESLPHLIWAADARGTRTYCNQRYLDYTGIASVTRVNLCWRELIHPEDRAADETAWERSLQSGLPYHCEYRLRRYDGVYRYFLSRALPVRHEDGFIQQWIGSSTDIHDQKTTEQLMRRLESGAAAGRLAAALAHEINNPLEIVTNAIYLVLQDRRIGKATRNYIELIEEEIARVAQVAMHTLRRESSAFSQQVNQPRDRGGDKNPGKLIPIEEGKAEESRSGTCINPRE